MRQVLSMVKFVADQVRCTLRCGYADSDIDGEYSTAGWVGQTATAGRRDTQSDFS